MKKMILSIAALSFVMIIGCAKADKVSEARAVLNSMTGVYETFANDIGKVANAKDAAVAINKFSDSVEPLMKKTKELEKKFPDLNFNTMKNPPKELEADFKKFNDMSKKMMSSEFSKKLTKYASDPEVLKAINKMVEKLGVK
jgi:outer membrane murein-binding lipoprotein Lpp